MRDPLEIERAAFWDELKRAAPSILLLILVLIWIFE